MTPGHISGLRQPHQQATSAHDPLPSPPAITTLPATDGAQTHFGRLLSSPSDCLQAHRPLRSLSATTALSANRRGPDTLRAHGPHWSTIVGPRSTLPAAAIAAAPGKSNAPFPTRRTSPVMTNDRVSPLSPWAESRRNGSAIRRSMPCGSPRHPASIFAAAS
ncbi:hypothetical protein SAMN02744133_102473 [Thalassospira xiamenensis M-5 = DSM 17429]|nr:hypothetical protein SAMN02744133_102473 [Thalassospira xiamenensis M-5 = DSM 17429]